MSTSKSPKILITGATGNIGQELTKYLVSKGIPFRAMVRSITDAERLAALPDVELVEGNFNDSESIERALSGIERAFLLTNSSEQAETQQIDFVNTAAETGLKHIVKLSQWAANLNSPVRFLRYHAVVEQQIIKSGMAYTFLRPNLFMQGLLGFRDTIVHQGQFYGAIGDAKISLVDTRDIATAAGEALSAHGHENKIYNLTGKEALSHQELAEKLSAATGRSIQFIDVPAEVLSGFLLKAGFPQWQAEGLIEDYEHYAKGEAAEVSSGVQEATGKLPRVFDAFARDYANVFSA